MAQTLGAQHLINAQTVENIPQAIAELTQGGVHVSVDALGSATTCWNSILSLQKKGRHVQIGLLAGTSANPPLPMGAVISKELEILGSHGLPPYMYPQILAMIKAGRLTPHQLVSRTIALDEVPAALSGMNAFNTSGITVINRFA
jgi:alcohol dehydrogenase